MAGITDHRAATLPTETTSFIGRPGEIDGVTRLLSKARLVTLVGVAGVGKTRLAVRVATQCRRQFRGGVWLIELAPVRDPTLIPSTVAQAIGLREDAGGDSLALVSEYLRERRTLLVLDNCEHLADECAVLCSTLLCTAPRLRILATSRHTLRVAGEYVWEVRPLSVPEPGAWSRRPDRWVHDPTSARGTPDPNAEYGALALLVERASAATPALAVTAEYMAQAAAVCQRLDGIPLAIEMAAARLRTMSMSQLLAGLDDRFRLLTMESRSEVPHHRTLYATIDWSFDLCAPAERMLWARLSVFVGGFDLDAVEEVCADAGIAEQNMVDLLDALLAKSILLVVGRDSVTRYRMLETLRQYGMDKLSEAGDETSCQWRHARRYLRLAEEAEREWFGPEQDSWFGWLRREHDNLRTALRFLSVMDAQFALRLAGTLWFHWAYSGRVAEGRIWLDRALAVSVEPTPDRAHALWANAFLAGIEGNMRIAKHQADEARSLADRLGDMMTSAGAMARLGVVAVYGSDYGAASPLLVQALERLAEATEADSAVAVLARVGLGMSLLGQDALDDARHVGQQAEAICRARRDRILLAYSLNLLGRIEWLAGHPEPAAERMHEALRLRGSDTAPVSMATAVEQLAWIFGGTEDHVRAATLLGAAEQIWTTFGLTRLAQLPYFRAPREECVTRLRQALAEGLFDAAWRHGRDLTVDQILDCATGRTSRSTGKESRPT